MTPYDLLSDLAACLCAELTPTGDTEPDVCFCGVVPGQEFAHDYVWGCDTKCGAAWVRLISAYPALAPGVPSTNERGCGQFLGFDIEVGVIRCLEQTEDGEAPTPEAMDAGVAVELSDMLAMRRAIKCCESLMDIDHTLGIYQATGPRGGIIGGRWTVSVVMN